MCTNNSSNIIIVRNSREKFTYKISVHNEESFNFFFGYDSLHYTNFCL